MKQTPIDIPCATPEDWLAHHKVTKCPDGFALGLSETERLFGVTATEGIGWAEVVKRQMNHGAKSAKRKKSKRGA